MSQRRKSKKKRRTESALIPDSPNPVETALEPPVIGWSSAGRWAASVAILIYLSIVLLGPLSNPVGSPHLTIPMARAVAPIHQAFYLGHGYRFFGPDPGPSHILVYEGQREDGTKFEGVFPDRDKNWPRLMYHRWFMLSETLFNEKTLTRSKLELTELSLVYEEQISRLDPNTQGRLIEQLKSERAAELAMFQANNRRLETLAGAVAKSLCQQENATSIQLSLKERIIPSPEEVRIRMKLNDAAFLSPAFPLGTYSNSEFKLGESEVIESEARGDQ